MKTEHLTNSDEKLLSNLLEQALKDIERYRKALGEIAHRAPIEGYQQVGPLRLRLVLTQAIAREALR